MGSADSGLARPGSLHSHTVHLLHVLGLTCVGGASPTLPSLPKAPKQSLRICFQRAIFTSDIEQIGRHPPPSTDPICAPAPAFLGPEAVCHRRHQHPLLHIQCGSDWGSPEETMAGHCLDPQLQKPPVLPFPSTSAPNSKP